MHDTNSLGMEEKAISSSFTNSYGDYIYLRNYFQGNSSPQKSGKFNLLSIHGIGTYHGWFRELADKVVYSGGQLTAFDLPGFGNSGKRGQIGSYRSWTEAVKLIYPDLAMTAPTFILGHSLGGIIALASLLELNQPPAGLILSVPAIKAHPKSYPLIEFVLPTFLKAFFSPAGQVSLPSPPEFAEMIERGLHNQSDLNRQVEARLLLEVLKLSWQAGTEKVIQAAGKTKILMLLAEGDQTCEWRASESYFGCIPSRHKTLIRYPRLGHDLFILSEADRINSQIISWIQSVQG